MRILVTIDNPDLSKTDFIQNNVSKVSSCLEREPGRLLEALVNGNFTGLVTHRRPSQYFLSEWHKRIGQPVYVAYVIGAASIAFDHFVSETQIRDSSLASIAKALGSFERTYAQRCLEPPCDPASAQTDSIVLVGAGIVNLITALRLTNDGHDITIVEKSRAVQMHWSQRGCTHAGDDARMFTFTEMDNYNNRDYFGSAPNLFRTKVEDGGWLALNGSLNSEEERWIEDFEAIPSWLAQSYNDDIFALSAESFHLWTDLISENGHIFDKSYLRSTIDRLYSDKEQFELALKRHERIGALVEEFSSDTLLEKFPTFVSGGIAGGFSVPGFTVNIHKLVAELINHLELCGVKFVWETPIVANRRNSDGKLIGFKTEWSFPDNAHIVISPGMYGNDLLSGSPCEGKIQGVIGGWQRVRNDCSVVNSIKLARRGHVTEDANITVAKDADKNDILILGSGYGFVGRRNFDICEKQLNAVYRGISDTSSKFLASDLGHNVVSSNDDENYGFKYCVRPWTATSLGIYHDEIMENGCRFIVTGGHNTGGFAQAPSIAEAVASTLNGASHPMHWMYSPERFENFSQTWETTENTEYQKLLFA